MDWATSWSIVEHKEGEWEVLTQCVMRVHEVWQVVASHKWQNH